MPGTFTIDTLLSAINSTLLNPTLTILAPLTLAARSPSFHTTPIYVTTAYFLFTFLLRLLWLIDTHLLSPGSKSRAIHWSDEVLLITGGAGGLGSCIAEVYSLRGVAVAVVDIAPESPGLLAEWELKGARYFHCDVGDRAAVFALKERIEKEMGVVTILVNNAAIVGGGALLDLKAEQVERVLRTNVLGVFWTVQAFLPGMLQRDAGGAIVNVSSVLGYLGCAGLSAYTASKGALTAFHRSVAAELEDEKRTKFGDKIRMVLVTPGQLSTALFASVKPPSEFFGPVVEANELCAEIVRAIDGGRSGEISIPLYARWIHFMFILPRGLRDGVVRRWSGLDNGGWKSFALGKKESK